MVPKNKKYKQKSKHEHDSVWTVSGMFQYEPNEPLPNRFPSRYENQISIKRKSEALEALTGTCEATVGGPHVWAASVTGHKVNK